MKTPRTCINQTLLIWSAIVVVEIFIIAYLMNFPWLIFTAIIMFWPARAAVNWPYPKKQISDNSQKKSLQN